MRNAKLTSLIHESLDLVVTENIDTVFQTVVRTLATHMEEHSQPGSGRLDKDNMIAEFEMYADEVVGSGHYQRKELPPGYAVTQMSWERVNKLSDSILGIIRQMQSEDALRFLGELTGAWILSCPEALIRRDAQVAKEDMSRLNTNADLNDLMKKWLRYALDVGR